MRLCCVECLCVYFALETFNLNPLLTNSVTFKFLHILLSEIPGMIQFFETFLNIHNKFKSQVSNQ